jgi:hypothetical protein
MPTKAPIYRDYIIQRSDAPSWCADMQWEAFPADYGGEMVLFGASPEDCRDVIDWHLD